MPVQGKEGSVNRILFFFQINKRMCCSINNRSYNQSSISPTSTTMQIHEPNSYPFEKNLTCFWAFFKFWNPLDSSYYVRDILSEWQDITPPPPLSLLFWCIQRVHNGRFFQRRRTVSLKDFFLRTIEVGLGSLRGLISLCQILVIDQVSMYSPIFSSLCTFLVWAHLCIYCV